MLPPLSSLRATNQIYAGSRSYQYCATCDKPGSLRDQDNRLRCL